MFAALCERIASEATIANEAMNATGATGIAPRDLFEPITPETLERLREAYPTYQRLSVAFALPLRPRDLDACRDLLAGRPVDPVRLDKAALFNARRKRLI